MGGGRGVMGRCPACIGALGRQESDHVTFVPIRSAWLPGEANAGDSPRGRQRSAMSDRAVAAARRSVKGDGEAGGKRPEPIPGLIADDHALVRRGLEMVLEEEDEIGL